MVTNKNTVHSASLHEENVLQHQSSTNSSITQEFFSPSHDVTLNNKEFFMLNNLESLTRKELKNEAKKRGLSKSGKNEELINRLMKYNSYQYAEASHTDLSNSSQYECNTTCLYLNDKENISVVNLNNQMTKMSIHDHDKKINQHNIHRSVSSIQPNSSTSATKSLIDPAQSDNIEIQVQHHPQPHHNDGDNEYISGEDAYNKVLDDIDIPETLKVLGTFKENTKKNKKNKTYKNSTRLSSNNIYESSINAQDNELSQEERQIKREKVVQVVLAKLLKNHTSGIHINQIIPEFIKMKVVKFSPTLLGYKSLTDWISHQPSSIVYYDKINKMIYPPNIGVHK